MQIEYDIGLGTFLTLGLLEIVAAAVCLWEQKYYECAVICYWGIKLIPMLLPRYSDWTCSHDHIGATQDMQMSAYACAAAGSLSVFFVANSASTPDWVVS